MILKNDSIHWLQLMLLTGEERLFLLLNGFVLIPNGEYNRRVDYRQTLDNMISKKLTKNKESREKRCCQ